MQVPRREKQNLPRPLRNPARDVFTSDAFCPRCDYNLKGLSPGTKCPECGAPIVTSARATAQDESITAAPRTYLILLAVGLGLMTLAGLIAAVLPFQHRPSSINWVVLVGLLAAGIWVVGSFIVTAPAPHAVVRRTTRRIERRLARAIIVLSQACWAWLPIGIGLAAEEDRRAMTLAATFGQPFQRTDLASMLASSAWAAAMVGLLGWLLLAYLLADLAQWASDFGLAERFRIVGLVIPFAALITLLESAFHDRFGLFSLVAYGAAYIARAAMVISTGLLLFSLGQLTNLTIWAMHNKASGDQFARRRERRERTYEQEMNDRLDPTPSAPIPESDRLTEPDAPPATTIPDTPLVIPASEHFVPRSGSPKPYDLDRDQRS